jgi:hypothetical protein
MIVGYHRAFPKDIRRLLDQYGRISPALGERLKLEIDDGIEQSSALPPAQVIS